MSEEKHKSQAVRPIDKVIFSCSTRGSDQYATTPGGLQVCITRQGLHTFNIGCFDPLSRLSEYVAIRMAVSGMDSTISTKVAAKEAVAVLVEMKNYSDQVLVTYAGGRVNEMLLFVRDNGSIHDLTMIVFEVQKPGNDVDISQFILQGKA